MKIDRSGLEPHKGYTPPYHLWTPEVMKKAARILDDADYLVAQETISISYSPVRHSHLGVGGSDDESLLRWLVYMFGGFIFDAANEWIVNDKSMRMLLYKAYPYQTRQKNKSFLALRFIETFDKKQTQQIKDLRRAITNIMQSENLVLDLDRGLESTEFFDIPFILEQDDELSLLEIIFLESPYFAKATKGKKGK